MSRWSRIVAWQRARAARAFSDNPPGYLSQQELEQSTGYTPGGIDVSIYNNPQPVRRQRKK